jgi:hypothetical protein
VGIVDIGNKQSAIGNGIDPGFDHRDDFAAGVCTAANAEN